MQSLIIPGERMKFVQNAPKITLIKIPHYNFYRYDNKTIEEFIKNLKKEFGERCKILNKFMTFIPDEKIIWHYHYRSMVNTNGRSITLTNYAKILYTSVDHVIKYYNYEFYIPLCFILRLQSTYNMENSMINVGKLI